MWPLLGTNVAGRTQRRRWVRIETQLFQWVSPYSYVHSSIFRFTPVPSESVSLDS